MDGKIKNNNFILIQGWMINDLNLKGNELLVYAIIYGFSQLEGQTFNGSLSYLAEWTNSTKQGVMKNLKSLLDKGYIQKEDRYINGVKFVSYYTTEFNGVLNKVEWGIKQSLPNNIEYNIEYNNNSSSIYDFIEQNFGRTLNSIEYELIREWEDNELTRYAIKQAILNGKYNLKYINTVLVSYKNNSITTVQQAQEEEQRFKNRNKKEYKKTSRCSAMEETLKEIYDGTIKL